MSENGTSATAHPPVCIGPDGEPVGGEPHFANGTCDCVCDACYSDGSDICICPECKGDECPDNIWLRRRANAR